MPNKREYTPVRPQKGGETHATSMSSPTRTACGRTCSGWIVALNHLGCLKCKAALHLPVSV